jgi:hypothetical protein
MLKFAAAIKAGADPQQIIAAARQWASAEGKNIGTEYVAMAATWLNQRRFEDYQAPTVEAQGFIAHPDSPQFKAWLGYAKDVGKGGLLRELQKRDLEGRAFNFEAEWPPRDKPQLRVAG